MLFGIIVASLLHPANTIIMVTNPKVKHSALPLIENMAPSITAELYAEIIDKKGWRTRFAPSPTGLLHVGHAYAAYVVWQIAGENPDKFLLRIDDLDYTRCSDKYIHQLKSDLSWLDISWSAREIYQSQRLRRYSQALQTLLEADLIYPCYLSRMEISDFLSPPTAKQMRQPNTRGSLSYKEILKRQQKGIKPALRLDMSKAVQQVGEVSWTCLDGLIVKAEPKKFGDIILGRRDITACYHLSVVLDDADTNIEVVTRGEDLRLSTDIHCLLQKLLGLPSPLYFHHPVILGEDEKKLSKSHKSPSLSNLRDTNLTLKNILIKELVINF
tara:strand:+ start:208 stop:1191 length:984 start_codon:yes stop_codon:yes gene_type:complete